jgi:glycosyltransferase involved in cell wall biosynthesis
MGYVFTARGAKASVVRGIVKLAYRILLNHPNSRVIFQNPDDQREFIANRLAPRESTILIKGSGVDTTLFSPRPELPGTPVVLFAGRLIWDKGVGEFVEAARLLKGSGTQARFVIVGDADEGNPETVSREQLQAWNAEGIVEWWGHRQDMPDVFAQSHIVCFPSYYREGIPKVLIEAAACGRPIVTADSPGCREAVRNGNSGLLVTPRHSAAVAEAVEALLKDASMRARMGRAGRELALAEFSIERIVAETLAVYHELRARASG